MNLSFDQLNFMNNNTKLPIYHTSVKMNFILQKFTTYDQLTKFYDPNLNNLLSNKGVILDAKIIVIQCQMLPQNMCWMFWRNIQQIGQFLQQIDPYIQRLFMNQKLKFNQQFNDTYQYFLNQHRQLILIFQSGNIQQIANNMHRFITFLNKVGQHSYLSKSIPFLLFINHCISIDKWNVMIHQQVFIYKKQSIIKNQFFSVLKKASFFNYPSPQEQKRFKKQVQRFITISADGLLISDNHLLLSRVQKMLPFTNQMKIKCFISQENQLIFEIYSGRIQKLKLNFHDNIENGVNFGIGLGRALKYSGYNFLMDLNSNQSLGFNTNNQINQSTQISNIKMNRFNSFAQIRSNTNCKLYNDGCGYYQDLYDQLMKAQKQVCITGWMITPYFLLKRPGSISSSDYRLDRVLFNVAERGVKVFIIVFMQPAMFVNNDSEHVQKHFQSFHKNIRVYRHPNVAIPQLWSHHQKLVIIDQKIGFMGGLDICYGRWDNPQHKLIQNQQDSYKKLWDGQQFNNYKIKDIYQPRIFQKTNLNKDFQPRMPWHDIAVQIRGDVVIDLLRHFVQYWYFVKSQISADPRRMLGLLQQRLMYAKTYHQKIQTKFLTQQLKTVSQQTIVQKLNIYKQKMGQFLYGQEERISQLLIEQKAGQNTGNLNIQMLRSASEWSIGLDLGSHQCSIHNAYQDLIQNSKEHIYIQNQFFMGLQNKIVEYLANRLIKAKRQNKKFRVVVVMPLLPGFQGYIGDPASTVLRIQMHWQYYAIKRGQNSLYNKLMKSELFKSPQQIKDYIYFFGLRKAQLLNNIPVTQIIYVHSKLMIVDDQRTIVGSANINDRSLLGNRDSQIAICIEHKDSNPYANQSFNLRKRLFQQHFGLTDNDSINVMDDSMWNKIKERAQNNTKIYRSIFGCLPDDQVKRSIDIEQWQASVADIIRWQTQHPKIIGHAVDFPLNCMQDEDLTFKPNQKQYYAPDHSFT